MITGNYDFKCINMTFEEVLKSTFTEVKVRSYGYDVVGLFPHYEPFGNSARTITFKIDRLNKELCHKWLYFNNEHDEVFEIEDGMLTCFDPELWARPDY